jgi:hypothetical protein
MKRVLILLGVIAGIFLLTPSDNATAQSPVAQNLIVVDANGAPAMFAVVPKGRAVRYAAKVTDADGKPIASPIEWKTEPAGVLKLEPNGMSVTVTPLRDWFDENPRREPVGRVIACTANLCASVAVTSVPDLNGVWPTTLKVEDLIIAHSENRRLVFSQTGRMVTFDPEPEDPYDAKRLTTLRIEGDKLVMAKSGTILTTFNGTLSDRSNGTGRWASSRGYHGSWRARKNP